MLGQFLGCKECALGLANSQQNEAFDVFLRLTPGVKHVFSSFWLFLGGTRHKQTLGLLSKNPAC